MIILTYSLSFLEGQWSAAEESSNTIAFNHNESLEYQIIKHDDFSLLHKPVTEWSLHVLRKESVDFMWFQLMIDSIIDLSPSSSAKTDFIKESLTRYQSNEGMRKKIRLFEDNYEPDQALTWYTKDSFIYRLINQAFRTKNIDEIFKYRYFISHLQHQLVAQYRIQNINKQDECITFYRGQCMCQQEFDSLHEGDFIAMNLFLSTTNNIDVARIYAGTSHSGFVAIVFRIKIDTKTETTPFADIREFSDIKDDGEVLIGIGCVFQIEHIDPSDNDLYLVDLLMKSETRNQSTKELVAYLKATWSSDQDLPPIITLANFTAEIGRYESAKFYYDMALKELPEPNSVHAGTICTNIGLVLTYQEYFKEALQRHETSLDIYKHILNDHDPLIAGVYINIGYVYDRMQRQKRKCNSKTADMNAECALKNYVLAKNILESYPNPEPDLSLLKVYNNIAAFYESVDLVDEGINYSVKVLKLKQTHFPHDYQSISVTYTNIGIFCCKKGQFNKALLNFRSAVKLKRKYLHSQHSDFAVVYSNFAMTYYKQHKFMCAWHCATKANEIASKHFLVTDSRRIKIDALCCEINNLVKTIENILRILPYILIWAAEQRQRC